MNPIELNLFASRLAAICDEMGVVLRRAAFSPNIRDRLDFSCALFDADGALAAQAAHIPVHLGSMAYAMRDLVGGIDWQPGDQVVLNDPYLGGTHLPDVTLIAPVFVAGERVAFVVNRAHHADIGAISPGSMPVSRTLEEEGLVIPPTRLVRGGHLDAAVFDGIRAGLGGEGDAAGDFAAQISANRRGVQRCDELLAALGVTRFSASLAALNDYGERLAAQALAQLPAGRYTAEDWLDDDGQGGRRIPLRLQLTVDEDGILADFAGTAPQVAGNVNCPLSVAAAGVYYVFRCLMPAQTPSCAGIFRHIRLRAPAGSVLNAQRPAAVAAGNVETSMRVVDLVCAALAQALPDALPAASQGTMNNIAMGGRRAGQVWDYYETLGGGMGAGRHGGGLSAVQTHMTNTLNTPVEVLESRYPLRIERYQVRRGSGGAGQRRGGDGLIRQYRFLAPARVTLLTERRDSAPWGLAGGGAGRPGRNLLNGEPLPAKIECELRPGDLLTLETPGGGGWGEPLDLPPNNEAD